MSRSTDPDIILRIKHADEFLRADPPGANFASNALVNRQCKWKRNLNLGEIPKYLSEHAKPTEATASADPLACYSTGSPVSPADERAVAGIPADGRGGRRRGLTRIARCRRVRPSCCCASRRRATRTPRRRRRRQGARARAASGGGGRVRAAKAPDSGCWTPWPEPAKGERGCRLGIEYTELAGATGAVDASRNWAAVQAGCGPY